ncbi:MAG TPA: hypothetical protein VME17_07455 [Bryobacteraceae bacterium]|nr:hypothetical protein [Bryobacteraceae bacterium]
MTASFSDGFIRRVCKLSAEHVAYRITHLEHSANPGRNRSWHGQRLQYTALAHDDLSVAIGQAALLDCSGGGNLVGIRLHERTRHFAVFVNISRKTGDSLFEIAQP